MLMKKKPKKVHFLGNMHFWGNFRGCKSVQIVRPCSEELFGISKASFLPKRVCKKFCVFKSYTRKSEKIRFFKKVF